MAAVERYIAHLAAVIGPLLVAHGGPVLMVQIENEYGSYGNDRRYLEQLRSAWERGGVAGPFYTADGPTPYMLEAGYLPGAAVGLDSGSSEKDWDLARSIAPGVPVFSAETYPGWLTHWGEKWARPPVDDLMKEVAFLLGAHKSFNLYVVHGGTNFGFTAGANSGGKGYEPDVTSYDYDAPISEQGRATPKFMALREMIGALPAGRRRAASDPGRDPDARRPGDSDARGRLVVESPAGAGEVGAAEALRVLRPEPGAGALPDDARRAQERQAAGDRPARLRARVRGRQVDWHARPAPGRELARPAAHDGTQAPVLDILVEGMGHINFGQAMIDRKGITDRVTLGGMTLMNWDVFLLPLTERWATSLADGQVDDTRPGLFFRGTFRVEKPADTFFDTTGYRKGVVFVNGHNLGRYWDIGPQHRLYCPASWLKAGENQVVVFDLLATQAVPIRAGAGHADDT